MRGVSQRYSLAVLAQKFARMSNREKTVGALLMTLLAVVVACGFGGLQTGILLYHAVILTVLAFLIHRYAKSVDVMAKGALDLGKANRREALISMARIVSEEKAILGEVLEELRRAELTPRPPFGLSAWEHSSGKLEAMRRWTDIDTGAIARCYEHLARQNMEVSFWQELQRRLEGLVNVEKRRDITMTLKALEHENLSAIRPVVSMLAARLEQ